MKREQAEALRGLKFYRNLGDEVEILRVINIDTVDTSNIVVKCKSDITDQEKTLLAEDLVSRYTKLINDGIIGFCIGKVKSGEDTWHEDVIICVYTSEDIDRNMRQPSMACRQYIRDFMYNLEGGPDNHDFVGCCVTYEDMPPQIGMDIMTSCDEIMFYRGVNFYISDSVNDILECLGQRNVNKFDKVLEKGFQEYIKHIHGLDIGQTDIKGRCRDLKTLMVKNNFQFQFDSLFRITATTIDMKDAIVHEENYDTLNDKLTAMVGYLFQKQISKAIVLEYDHDIDLSLIDKNNVIMIRDISGKLYLVHVTVEGEYLKADLDKERYYEASKLLLFDNKYGTKSKS